MKYVGFKEYVREILKTAEYKDNIEEARDNLIDAIELWITVGLRDGEEMPLINGAKLVTAAERIEKSANTESTTYA
jgi:predicted RNase H-like HicB family nuclease